MAVVKPPALAGFLKQDYRSASAFLVYGADSGKVHETAATLVRRIAGSLDEPFRIVHLREEDLAADPGRLADEFFAVPMFGGARAVWVSEAGRAFSTAVAEVLGKQAGGNAIIAEAGNLRKGSALLTQFERTESAFAIPCYTDRADDITEIAQAMAAQAGVSISRDARALLVAVLGDDRSVSRSEIEKLLLYTLGKAEITVDDVADVCSGRLAPPLDDLCDAVLGGDIATTDSVMHILLEGGTAGSRLLSAAANHVAVLRGLAAEVAAGARIPRAIDAARPQIFWLRQRKVAEQLQRWQEDALSRAANTLAQATLAARETPALEPQIAARALLSLARQRSAR